MSTRRVRWLILAGALVVGACGAPSSAEAPAAPPPPAVRATAPATSSAALPGADAQLPAGASQLPSALAPVARPASPEAVAAASTTAEPTRLLIPQIGVDAPVSPVGVEADGQMGLPYSLTEVGWYEFGPSPGASGSAVVAGHVTIKSGRGALYRLGEVSPGAEVAVEDSTGSAQRFVVTQVRRYDKVGLPVDRVFARDGDPRLTLVTCSGPYSAQFGGYRDNLVVTAEPVGSSPPDGP